MKSKTTQDNLVLLNDLELIFGLPYLLPMLEVVHTLIKFVQCRDVFIVEFMVVIKC
jgi:hypothetical protein